MRRNSNLPSLQLHNSSSNKHHPISTNHNSKDSVKLIESKITRQQSQIQRNQKVILSLTNQFRLLKDQLKLQQQENQEITEMYRKTADDNQKLIKQSKQHKMSITRLERLLDASNNAKQNKEEMYIKQKQYIEEAQAYEEQIAANKREIKVMEATNHDLLKQIQELKKRLKDHTAKDKKEKKANQQEKQQLKKSFNRSLNELQQKISKQSTIIRQLEQENERISEIKNDRDCKVRELNKIQDMFKEAKEKLSLKTQQLKFARQRVGELEGAIKKSGQQDEAAVELAQKFERIQINEIELKMKISQLTKKNEDIQEMYQQEHKINKRNEKKLTSIKRLLRNKENLFRITKSVKQSILCQFCQQILEHPVTNIPCGHSYCLGCKKGYERECKKCTNVKREAVYRNQLMDEIIEAYKGIKDISDTLSLFSDPQS